MVVVKRIADAKGFSRFLQELKIRGSIFVVKPSWDNANAFTSAETLDWLFTALDGNLKVIEGYSEWRNELNTGEERRETVSPANVKARWKWIKAQDHWFLEWSGISRVLARHKVEYINVTEEVWSMNALSSDEVRDLVDNKYGILVSPEMYRFVPTRIYALRGCTLISLNNSRLVGEQVSLSTENLFGLIPNPVRRAKWRGKRDSHFSQSIVDINKIYRSLFSPCYWINEIKEQMTFVGSRNSVEADAVTAKLVGLNPDRIDYLRHAANVFGGYDKNVLSNMLG